MFPVVLSDLSRAMGSLSFAPGDGAALLRVNGVSTGQSLSFKTVFSLMQIGMEHGRVPLVDVPDDCRLTEELLTDMTELAASMTELFEELVHVVEEPADKARIAKACELTSQAAFQLASCCKPETSDN
jgi:hypothetical protein